MDARQPRARDCGPRTSRGSLYELLSRRYRIVPGAARITIEPVVPDAETRRLLTIAPGQACLRLQMVDADVRGRVIMVASCVYRGDKYQLTADITGRGVRRRCPAAGRMTTEDAAVPADGVGEGGANATLRILAVDGGQSAIRVRLREGDAVETDGVSRIAGQRRAGGGRDRVRLARRSGAR